jgi:hypothetical protein
MVGGIVSSLFIVLLVFPAIYSYWKDRKLWPLWTYWRKVCDWDYDLKSSAKVCEKTPTFIIFSRYSIWTRRHQIKTTKLIIEFFRSQFSITVKIKKSVSLFTTYQLSNSQSRLFIRYCVIVQTDKHMY